MGPSPGNWLAAYREDLTLGKTAICIFVAKLYGRMPFQFYRLCIGVMTPKGHTVFPQEVPDKKTVP